MYLVKSTPIYSNKKLYRVGEIFPYSDKEKHLLWNLTLVEAPKEIVPKTLVTTTETPIIVSKAKTKKSISKK